MAYILSRVLTTTGGSVTIEPVGLFESEEAAKGASDEMREVIGMGLREQMSDSSPVGLFLELCGVKAIAFRISRAEVRNGIEARPNLVSIDGGRLQSGPASPRIELVR